jgi:hypothetical protein
MRPGRRRQPRKPFVYFEYYQIPFQLFHQDLEHWGYDPSLAPDVVRTFWGIVPPGLYEGESAREIMLRYMELVEKTLALHLSQHSVGYWLHAYRRLAPGHVSAYKDDQTTLLTRAVLEAAFQKYGSLAPCDGVGLSNEIEMTAVFKGLLMEPRLAFIREALQQKPQLVLTNFDSGSLRKLYNCERLALEIWRAGAALRIIGKGAGLIVDPSDSHGFRDNRSDELHKLVMQYDERQGHFQSSATGTVFLNPTADRGGHGGFLIAQYNVAQIPAQQFNDLFKRLKFELSVPGVLNFFWAPFNLQGYLESHQPLAEAFALQAGVRLECVLGVLGALCARMLAGWMNDRSQVLRFWQRGYEGPHSRDYVMREIGMFLPAALKYLSIQMEAADVDLVKVIRFLELTEEKRSRIDPGVYGPHSVFLPYGTDRLFIDYAWIGRVLFNLFFGIELSDQNFKGEALEKHVRAGKSILPVGPCKSLDRTRKQVDAAFEAGDTLIISECRAFALSVGFDRGDPEAIRYRTDRIDKALNDVDEKARWLAKNPRGTNYDILRFRKILPVVVTPFVEYIPSRKETYWLSDNLPRVLSPMEIREALANGSFNAAAETTPNAVRIETSR